MTDDDRRATGPGLSTGSSIEAVQSLYDRWAGIYDWNPVLALVRPARRRAVEALDLEVGDTVVDLGTGTGGNLRYLREAVGAEGTVIGVDVSEGMLSKAAERVAAAGWTNVTLVRGDIRDPPLAGPVDGVLSAFVVVMYADPEALIGAWSGLLDGGRMAHLYAGPSDRRSAPVVNQLLNGYLRAFEEGWGTEVGGPNPLEVLAERGDRVRTAMGEVATGVHHESHTLGLVRLSVGRSGPPAN